MPGRMQICDNVTVRSELEIASHHSFVVAEKYSLMFKMRPFKEVVNSWSGMSAMMSIS